MLHSLSLCDKREVVEYKEKYESLSQEFEDCKQQMKYSNVANMSYNIQSKNVTPSNDKNIKTQIHLLRDQNNNLEERIRVLSNEIMNKKMEMQVKVEHQEKASFSLLSINT